MNICPKPLRWKRIYELLCTLSQRYGIKSSPPVPLILAGWVYSNDSEKAARWAATEEWAARHDLESLIIIPAQDWYCVDKPTTYEIGPFGGPMYLSWRDTPCSAPSRDQVEAALERLINQWKEISGPIAKFTTPYRITGKKYRRLLVTRSSDAPPPPWGGWEKLADDESRRKFTGLRSRVNEIADPVEIDHIDFQLDSLSVQIKE